MKTTRTLTIPASLNTARPWTTRLAESNSHWDTTEKVPIAYQIQIISGARCTRNRRLIQPAVKPTNPEPSLPIPQVAPSTSRPLPPPSNSATPNPQPVHTTNSTIMTTTTDPCTSETYRENAMKSKD